MTTPMEKRALDIEDKKDAAMTKASAIMRLVQESLNEVNSMNKEILSEAIWAAADLIDDAKEAEEEFMREAHEMGVHISLKQRNLKREVNEAH